MLSSWCSTREGCVAADIAISFSIVSHNLVEASIGLNKYSQLSYRVITWKLNNLALADSAQACSHTPASATKHCSAARNLLYRSRFYRLLIILCRNHALALNIFPLFVEDKISMTSSQISSRMSHHRSTQMLSGCCGEGQVPCGEADMHDHRGQAARHS